MELVLVNSKHIRKCSILRSTWN